jgi:glycine/D-amino acid oxidase-like deaminating enzyme
MLPSAADVVVIGGGIAGCSTAWEIAKRGGNVVLLEKGRIGGEQSSRAWGFVRQQGRDPSELAMMVAGNKIWQGLEAELGEDIEWVQAGNLKIAYDDQRLEELRGWLPIAREFKLDTELLTPSQIRELIPGILGRIAGGMFTPSDGHAEPSKATSAIGRAAERAGAQVFTYCAAEAIEMSGGHVSGVVTEKGTIQTPIVVCAAGGWSKQLARGVGLSLPQITVRNTVAESTTAPPITPVCVWAPDVAFRQRPGGTFYLAGGGTSDYDITTESFRNTRLFAANYLKNRKMFHLRVGADLAKDVLRKLPGSEGREHPFAHTVDVEPEPNLETAWSSLEGLKRMFPMLGDLGMKRVFAGMIDSTPDALPVMGDVDAPRGFFFATGFSGHGFALGPIVGKVMSELILDGRTDFDLYPLRFSRFAEGDMAKAKKMV